MRTGACAGLHSHKINLETIRAATTFQLANPFFRCIVKRLSPKVLFIVVFLLCSTVASAVTISVAFTNPTCQQCNGSFTATGANGTAPYQYSINGGVTWFSSGTFTAKCAGTYTVIVRDALNNQASQTITLVNAVPVVFTATGTNCTTPSSCDGAITVTITGGTPPYTVTLTGPSGPIPFTLPTVTGLCVGTYTITVVDAISCPGHLGTGSGATSATVSIGSGGGNTSPLTIAVSSSGPNNCITPCNYLYATASGGIPPYQYNFGSGWTSSSTSACLAGAGVSITYTVCIRDAIGSTLCQSVLTSWPDQYWFPQATVTPAYCGGCNGTIVMYGPWAGTVFSISGNPTPQSSPVFSNLCPGTYTVSVVPGNTMFCPKMVPVTVPNTPGVLGVTTSVTAAACNAACNGSVTINAVGAGSFEYSIDGGNTWQSSNTFSSLCAGNYTAQVRNTSLTCNGSAAFTITQPAAFNPVVTATSPSCYGGCNGSISTSISPSSSYQYSINGGVTYQTSPTFGAKCAGNYTITVRQNSTGCTTNVATVVNPRAQIVTSLSNSVSPPCSAANTGSLSVNATGGTGLLTYNWLPGNPTGDGTPTITNLTANTYSCIVTDANSCTTTFTAQLTALPAPTLQVSSVTDVSCFGGNTGAASVSITGASPYTYDWTPGNPPGDGTAAVTGLTAGSWTCTITAGAPACSAVQTIVITAPPAVTGNVTAQTSISCYGAHDGSATVIGGGGVGSYSYVWSPSGATDTTANLLGIGTHSCLITDANGCTATQTVAVAEPAALLIAPGISSDVTCNGMNNGTAAVVVSGGTASYQYDWLPGSPNGDGTSQITALFTGTYSCTVTDAHGCTATYSVNVTEPSAVDVLVTNQSSPSCAGDSTGNITVATNGGTPGYAYTWLPYGGTNATANALAAGSFSCTVTDALGCMDTVSLTLTEPPAVNMIIESVSNADCFGSATGDANVVAFGGAGAPFTYQWQPIGGNSGTAIGLPAGTYTCTATDSLGCSDSVVVTVGTPAALIANVVSTSEFCAACNGTATASASGGNGGYGYYWQGVPDSSFVGNLCNGQVELVVTDSLGCSDTVQFSISNLITLHIDSVASAGTSVWQNNGTATVFATGSGSLTYQWDSLAGNQTTSTAINLAPGNYCVIVSDSAGCTDTVCVNVALITNVISVDAHGVSVFPNPFTDELLVNGTGSAHLQLKDVQGRIIVDFGVRPLDSGAHLAMPADLDAGMYLLSLVFEEGVVNVKVLRH